MTTSYSSEVKQRIRDLKHIQIILLIQFYFASTVLCVVEIRKDHCCLNSVGTLEKM